MEAAAQGQLVHACQGGQAQPVQGIHQLVQFGIQVHHRGVALPFRRQGHVAVFIHNDGVRTEQEQVGSGLDGEETGTRDIDGPGAREAFDARAHGRFQLVHRGGFRIAGVERFFIADHGQREHAAVGVQNFLEGVQAYPERIGVEVAVPGDILEFGNVLIRALGHFPQNQLAVRLPDRQVAAFPVRLRAAGDFHDEGSAAFRKPAEEVHVKLGAQIVGIGDKGVFNAIRQQAVQPAGPQQGRIQVPMAGRAPFQLRLLRAAGRGEAVRQNFRHAVLHQFHLGRVRKAVRRVFFQVGQRVRAGGERIHQQKAHRRAGDGAQMLHLPDDQIQERILSFYFQQAFRLLEAHARAEAAVELDAYATGNQVLVRRGGGGRDVLPVFHLVGGQDVRFRNHAGVVGNKGFVTTGESVDGRG